MARRVSFGKPRRARKEESFAFGLNVMTGKQKKAYRRQLRKAGKGGGS
jgi:hypothetical protein